MTEFSYQNVLKKMSEKYSQTEIIFTTIHNFIIHTIVTQNTRCCVIRIYMKKVTYHHLIYLQVPRMFVHVLLQSNLVVLEGSNDELKEKKYFVKISVLQMASI